MLKRRPSKRFVLAETGEETAWNTTTDNDMTTSGSNTPQIPQIDIGLTSDTAIVDEEEAPAVAEEIQQTVQQRLAVPQTTKSGMK
jgi:hypothetical protein